MKTLFTLAMACLLTFQSNAQWTSQYSGFTLSLFDVSFLTVNKGYTVGQFLTVIETHDGGAAWNTKMSTTTNWLVGCSFTDTSTGYAVTNLGTTYKTTDAGTTWNIIPTGTTNPLYTVRFINKDTGFICGLWTMLRTFNAGVTWTSYPVSYSLNQLFFPGNTTGYCVGDGGKILKTSNCGGSWGLQTSGVTKMLNGVFFTDTATGWVVGNAGTILHTINGGITWTPVTSGVTNDLSSVIFNAPATGYIVGSSGTILKTTDAGVTWNAEISGTTEDLTEVTFPSSSIGYAVGSGGTILKTTCGVKPLVSFTETGVAPVAFTYTGGTMDSVKWDFGDGDTSYLLNPAHTYAAPGTFNVCIVGYSPCGNDTSCHTVTVSSLNANNNASQTNIIVYPNPTTNLLTIKGVNGGSIQIHNMIGKMLHKHLISSDHEVISIEQLPKGLYTLLAIDGQGVKTIHRISKE